MPSLLHPPIKTHCVYALWEIVWKAILQTPRVRQTQQKMQKKIFPETKGKQ